jgi:hypothetical protein
VGFHGVKVQAAVAPAHCNHEDKTKKTASNQMPMTSCSSRCRLEYQHCNNLRDKEIVMERTFGKMLGMLVMVAMLCLIGLVMSGEAQAERFTDNGNGTVTDTVTNLMWTKDANPFEKLNWSQAVGRCGSFSISGIGGWRLPSKDELVALYHAIQGGHPFTGVQASTYWSETDYPVDNFYALYVSMVSGHVDGDFRKYTHHVWCVLDGQ